MSDPWGSPVDSSRKPEKGRNQAGIPPSVLRSGDVNMAPREQFPGPQMNPDNAKCGDLCGSSETSPLRVGRNKDTPPRQPRRGRREKSKFSQVRGGFEEGPSHRNGRCRDDHSRPRLRVFAAMGSFSQQWRRGYHRAGGDPKNGARTIFFEMTARPPLWKRAH